MLDEYDSLIEIAQEKFGIVKKDSLIISAAQEKSVLKLLQNKFPNNKKIIFGKDFFLEKNLYFSKQKKIATSISLKNSSSHQLENALHPLLPIFLLCLLKRGYHQNK